MVVTNIGPASIANIVSILQFPRAAMPKNAQSVYLFPAQKDHS